MNDFMDQQETLAFASLGPLPKSHPRFTQMDQYLFDTEFTRLGFDMCSYQERFLRFSETFSSCARAPGGGDVVYLMDTIF